MNSIAIEARSLGKEYHIGKIQNKSDRFGEQITDLMLAPTRRALKMLRGQASSATELDEEIWALKDVSFEINQGEVVGIIGRNGAGKSTLLKVLSRITEPTEGYADIFGRVGSLLEVGTGFHPELTGRENIYLNGAILGMGRSEINRKFDDIVEFAEIDRFIDTPVKHYSSGMYVRLAFSVAAHLDPEILLVDEVLAVGDVAFQRKCLGKMDDVAQQGRTVLFVSHNMGLLQTLCQRGLFLHEGQLFSDGPIGEVVDQYLATLEQSKPQDLLARVERKGAGKVRLTAIEIDGGSHSETTVLKTGSPTRFTIHVDKIVPGLSCNILIYDSIGQPVTNFESKVRSHEDAYEPANSLSFRCEVDELLLRPGRYRVDLALIGDNVLQDFIEGASTFDVGEGVLHGRPAVSHKKFRILIPHRWVRPVD